ncbi:MAG: DeoR family transcriptional regulator, catabolite repression regulator [Thermosediminibacterales bacterium]|nr:DeoR family transcriptional regulator, catabolite repression regulator [Thermosediminibacterales bacterium]
MAGILDARPRVGYFYAGKSILNFVAEHLRKTKVKDIKGLPVIIQENTSVYDAVVTLFLEDVGTLFVTNEKGGLSGVVSRKDLLKIAIGNMDIHKVPVGIIMTRMPNIITVSPEDTVYEAAVKIVEHEVDALPVVVQVKEDKEGDLFYKVIGKITKTSITKLFVELGKTT